MSARSDSERYGWLANALRPYLFGTEDPSAGVLLAVSGGPDSTALMHAAAQAGAAIALSVATVDHGLRSASAAEAASVATLANSFGLPHQVLTWASPRRAGGVQEAARAARYDLLAAHAAAIGARTLLTAHTADDQAETVLMRLLAGSGPAGLVGMRRERTLVNGVRLARPFLGVEKAELIAYCAAHRLPVIGDPSNVDERYARPRLRRLLPSLAREGLSAARLRRLAERLSRDEAALARAAAAVLAEAKLPSQAVGLSLDGARLAAQPESIVLRAIDAALDGAQPAGGSAAPRRLERLERLVLDGVLPALEAGRRFRGTLRGVLVEVTAGGEVRLAPAPPRRRGQAGRHLPARCSLAAAPPDLLGKGEPAAYIDRERVE